MYAKPWPPLPRFWLSMSKNTPTLASRLKPPTHDRCSRCGPAGHQVKSEGEAVCHLESGGFVGSMAFNRFIQEPPIRSRSARRPRGVRGEHQQADSVSDERFVTEADANSKGVVKGAVETAKAVVLDMLRGPSVVGKVAMSVVPDVVDERQDLTKMERSKNTVTATSDVSARLQRVNL